VEQKVVVLRELSDMVVELF
jgi:hypothetical protein